MCPQYFDPKPLAASRPGTVEFAFDGIINELEVDTGVFASRRIDAGTTELLKATYPTESSGTLLDLGCGYGPIACALARRAPQSTVWAVDVNERALDLTRRNAERLGLANVRTARPEQVPDDLTFTGMWSNPPIRIGKEALHDLLGTWVPRLRATSPAWMVVQRHLGADSLSEWMATLGWEVRRVGSRKGYRILKVVPRP